MSNESSEIFNVMFTNPYERVFGGLYMTSKDPIGHQQPSHNTMSELLSSSRNYKELVKNSFGFDSPKILSMVGQKTVATKETEEYVYDVPNVKIEPGQIVANAGDGSISVTPGTTWITSYITSSSANFTSFVSKKKITKVIDDTLFMKGFFLKDLLSVDYMYKIIESHHFNDFHGFYFNNEERELAREFLKLFDQSKIVKIINFMSGMGSLIDTARQYFSYRDRGCIIPKNWKNLTELHDDISKQIREIKAIEASKDIKYTDLTKSLDGLKINENISMALPPNTAALVKWGSELNNCLSSYDGKVLSGKSLIVGVIKNSKLTYAIEIINVKRTRPISTEENIQINLEIKQFYGYSNTKPEKEDEFIVRGLLETFIREFKDDEFLTEIVESQIPVLSYYRADAAGNNVLIADGTGRLVVNANAHYG